MGAPAVQCHESALTPCFVHGAPDQPFLSLYTPCVCRPEPLDSSLDLQQLPSLQQLAADLPSLPPIRLMPHEGCSVPSGPAIPCCATAEAPLHIAAGSELQHFICSSPETRNSHASSNTAVSVDGASRHSYAAGLLCYWHYWLMPLPILSAMVCPHTGQAFALTQTCAATQYTLTNTLSAAVYCSVSLCSTIYMACSLLWLGSVSSRISALLWPPVHMDV